MADLRRAYGMVFKVAVPAQQHFIVRKPWARRHAGYVLWLLDRPEVPNTRHVWRTWLAAASGERPLAGTEGPAPGGGQAVGTDGELAGAVAGDGEAEGAVVAEDGGVATTEIRVPGRR
ncbi:hypothetical protein [Streptomyces sp. SM11]|uniref:hypothetical protein n=1 Tax=Streptomyces sp. SM11 TaxID=565557 RepID=UPI000CD4B12F|nr:hypothetical protein [Streptomyces sp. SM11]